jgi:spore coat protein U-like protein
MRKSAISALAGIVLVTGASSALALTATASFDVQVDVQSSCSVTTPALLDFGPQVNFTTDIDAAAFTITVNCSNNLDYDVTLNNGLNATRRMRMGATTNYVDYEIYTDTNYNVPWPSTPGTPTLTGTGNPQNIDIYARIPAQPTPVFGVYTDTLQVTVTY